MDSDTELAERLAFLEDALGDEARARLEQREHAERARRARRAEERRREAERVESERLAAVEAQAEALRLARRDELMARVAAILDEIDVIGDELGDLAQASTSAMGKTVWVGRGQLRRDRLNRLLTCVEEGWPPFAGMH